MASTHTTPKSSRLGNRGYKVPERLRFRSLPDAIAHIKANKLKVINHVSHTRGLRINVVDRKTQKARTISVELPPASKNGDAEEKGE